jgi:plasmid stability protein
LVFVGDTMMAEEEHRGDDMTTLTLKLPQSLDRALSIRARKQNRTKSALARQALEQMLSEAPREGRVTVADLAGDLIGKLAGGPPDLSHNKRHMKGFGT